MAKRFTILRSRETLQFLARFFGQLAAEAYRRNDMRYAYHFARKAASRYFEAR